MTDVPADFRGADDRPRSEFARAAGDGSDPPPLRRKPGRRGRKTFAELFPQLFLFPLLLVTVGVLVYLFFIASAQDHRTISELINDMQSGSIHSRWRTAKELADRFNERYRRGDVSPMTLEESRSLVALLERSGDEELFQQHIVATLGQAGQPAVCLPAVKKLVMNPRTGTDLRISALEAIGRLGGEEEVAFLLGELEALEGREPWELRLLAIHALVSLESSLSSAAGSARQPDARVAEALRRHVNDPRREISWNTAYFLAFYFDDPAGAAILRELLDWKHLEGERGDHGRKLTAEEQEAWMQRGLKGLFRIEGEALIETVREKARDARSAKVRNAALEILREIEGKGRREPAREMPESS
jgi:hypothetical protein